MLVSNFELVNFDNPYGRRNTWYELHITNLEQQPICFDLTCDVNSPAAWDTVLPVTTSRSFVAKVLRLSSPGGVRLRSVRDFRRRGGVVRCDTRMCIDPLVTDVFTLEVDAVNVPDVSEVHLFGTVSLSVPVLFQSGAWTPQIDHPVRVLLHARRSEIRDAERTTKGGRSISSESVLISTGRAENEIEPDIWLSFGDVVTAKTHVRKALPGRSRDEDTNSGAESIPEEERLTTLVELLLGVARHADGTELTTIVNDALGHVASPVRVQFS